MITPEEKDIGRKVVYTGNQTRALQEGVPFEEGVITGMTDFYVFVRYGEEKISKATRREDLEWCE